MDNQELQQNVAESCEALIKELVDVIRRDIGVKTLPNRQVPYILMEPSGPGSETGRECTFEENDFSSVWDKIEKIIKTRTAWKLASDVIDTFIRAFDVKPEGLVQDIGHSYLLPLCGEYINAATSVTYKRRVSLRVINGLLNYLNAQGSYYIGLAILTDFKACRPFKLTKDINVRPLSEKDIPLLINRLPIISHHDANNWIFSKWWVCEIKMMNQRGTFVAQNKISGIIHDELPVIFRMYKQGNRGIRLGALRTLGPYGDFGVSRGSLFERIGIGTPAYILSNTEIKQLVKFYEDIQPVMANQGHYLQVPLRRMRYAGTRREKADSVIDYVIGLESLLSSKDEQQTEIGYRFRIRGSVILARKRTQRPYYIKKLKRLYELRSAIAHGAHVSDRDLSELIPFAEDTLRYVWKWYFAYYRSETNNQLAIDRIDSDLAVK